MTDLEKGPESIFDVPKARLRTRSWKLLRDTDWFKDKYDEIWLYAFYGFMLGSISVGYASSELGWGWYASLAAIPVVLLLFAFITFCRPRGRLGLRYWEVRRKLNAHLATCKAFNLRLASVQHHAALPGSEVPEAGVASKFMDELSELNAIADSLDNEVKLRDRELSQARMAKLLGGAPNQGQYRETRDISDLVYANTEKLAIDAAPLEEALAECPDEAKRYEELK